MGANDAAEMLEVAKAECVRLERRVAELTAALEQSTPHPDNDRAAITAIIADRLSWSSLHWEVGTTDMHKAVADALIAAGFGRLPVVETVTEWEYRDQLIAGFPRPKNVFIEKQRRRKAGEWLPVEDGESNE